METLYCRAWHPGVKNSKTIPLNAMELLQGVAASILAYCDTTEELQWLAACATLPAVMLCLSPSTYASQVGGPVSVHASWCRGIAYMLQWLAVRATVRGSAGGRHAAPAAKHVRDHASHVCCEFLPRLRRRWFAVPDGPACWLCDAKMSSLKQCSQAATRMLYNISRAGDAARKAIRQAGGVQGLLKVRGIHIVM